MNLIFLVGIVNHTSFGKKYQGGVRGHVRLQAGRSRRIARLGRGGRGFPVPRASRGAARLRRVPPRPRVLRGGPDVRPHSADGAGAATRASEAMTPRCAA